MNLVRRIQEEVTPLPHANKDLRKIRIPMTMPRRPTPAYIGTAGWAIPRDLTDAFPGDGSHLTRYARIFPCAEINATFYRQPRASTLARWLDSVPPGFRFSVKAPKSITHTAALAGTSVASDLAAFLNAIAILGPALGPLLFQLPPSLVFDEPHAGAFFSALRDQTAHPAVLEPRHPTWFTPTADALLRRAHIARAAVDPARSPSAAVPGGWPGLIYYRLHGSPRTYYTAYTDEYLTHLAPQLHRQGDSLDHPPDLTSPAEGNTNVSGSKPPEAWCIFDNTASGAAAGNALTLERLLEGKT